MFTHQVVERISDLVLVRALVTERAVPFSKRLAERTVGIQAKAMLSFEEFGKAKLVYWGGLLAISHIPRIR